MEYPVRRHQHVGPGGGVDGSEGAQRDDLVVGDGRGRFGHQPRDRHDGLHEALEAGVVAHGPCDPRRDPEGVEGPTGEFIGAGQHPDRAHGAAAGDTAVERFEKGEVGRVAMAQEVHDGVDGQVCVAGQEGGGPGRDIGAERSQAGGVDQLLTGESIRRPAHVEALEVRRIVPIEIDDEFVSALEPQRVTMPGSFDGGDLVAGTVAVPGHDAGAFAGVGGCEPLPDEGVEQGRLARLHHPGDGYAQGFVEQLVQPVEGRAFGEIGMRDHAANERADVGGER